MTNSGWIKLHRQFLNWEWSDNPDMVALWVHLLLMSNHDSQKWHGINIERGQCVTGRLKLAKITGLSQRSIRTCLTKLKTTNEIAIETTNQYSIITICNYDKYQTISSRSDQQNDQQTGQRPTNDRPATDHKQELKELKNEEEYIRYPSEDSPLRFTEKQIKKAVLQLGQEKFDYLVHDLIGYSEQKPKLFKQYASHYRTILNWDRMKTEDGRTFGKNHEGKPGYYRAQNVR